MIPALLLLTASTFTVSNSVYHGPVKRPANARLVWHDEFAGSALDRDKWQYDISRNKVGWYNKRTAILCERPVGKCQCRKWAPHHHCAP